MFMPMFVNSREVTFEQPVLNEKDTKAFVDEIAGDRGQQNNSRPSFLSERSRECIPKMKAALQEMFDDDIQRLAEECRAAVKTGIFQFFSDLLKEVMGTKFSWIKIILFTILALAVIAIVGVALYYVVAVIWQAKKGH